MKAKRYLAEEEKEQLFYDDDDEDPLAQTRNLHKNFLDMGLHNPEIRKQRVNKIADKWLYVLRTKIKDQVQ